MRSDRADRTGWRRAAAAGLLSGQRDGQVWFCVDPPGKLGVGARWSGLVVRTKRLVIPGLFEKCCKRGSLVAERDGNVLRGRHRQADRSKKQEEILALELGAGRCLKDARHPPRQRMRSTMVERGLALTAAIAEGRGFRVLPGGCAQIAQLSAFDGEACAHPAQRLDQQGRGFRSGLKSEQENPYRRKGRAALLLFLRAPPEETRTGEHGTSPTSQRHLDHLDIQSLQRLA